MQKRALLFFALLGEVLATPQIIQCKLNQPGLNYKFSVELDFGKIMSFDYDSKQGPGSQGQYWGCGAQGRRGDGLQRWTDRGDSTWVEYISDPELPPRLLFARHSSVWVLTLDRGMVCGAGGIFAQRVKIDIVKKTCQITPGKPE